MVDPLSDVNYELYRKHPSKGSYFSFQPVLHDMERVVHVAAAGFLSRYLNGALPHIRGHITVK